MFKKLIIASAVAAALTGCGSSDDTTTSTGGSDDGGSGSSTAAVIGGDIAVSFYYKEDAEGTLTIVDPDDGEEAFITQSNTTTTHGTFSIDANGSWTLDVPEADALADLEADETASDSVIVTSIDGTEQEIDFTILSADAPRDDDGSGGGDDDGDDDDDADPVYACADAMDVSGSDTNPTVGGLTYEIDADDLSSTLAEIGTAGDAEIIITGGDSISLKDVCFDAPVLIRAATVGSVTLESASINRSQNIILQGFEFGPNDNSTLVKIADSRNIKILRNKFDHAGVEAGQTSVVISNASEKVTVAYNEFLDKDVISVVGTNSDGSDIINSGSYIKFQVDELDDGTYTMSTEAHIHHNYFKNIVPHVVAGNSTPEGDSDREAIVFGDQDSQNIDTYHVIEYNLFEDTDGENEIMTVKTSNNTFNNNTFLNSMGSLSFRLGDDNKALDNYFYGTGDSTLVTDPNYQTGGIRLYGENHVVTGNYMSGLTGIDWRNPILIDSGDTSDTSNSNGHEVANNVTVTDNILVDNVGGGIHIGGDFHPLTGENAYARMPTNITITNNMVEGTTGNLFNNFAEQASNTWSGNKAYVNGDAVGNAGGQLDDDAQLEILSGSMNSSTDLVPLLPADVGPSADLPI